MIQIDEINENNIADVLRQVGFDFGDFKLLSTDLTKNGDCKPADFVVQMGHKVQAVDLLDGPVDEAFVKNAICKIAALHDNISFKPRYSLYTVLSTFEDSRFVNERYDDITFTFKLYSLKDVSL